MLYRNKNTGALVEFSSEVKGGPWELCEVPGSAKDPKVVKAPKKTGTKKK